MAEAVKGKKRGRGRPPLSEIDPGVRDKILQAVRTGNYIETAAAYAGISKDTLYRWMKEGARDRREGKSSELRDFSDAMEKAIAESEIHDVLTIATASKAAWQAAAWRLERRYPGKWGRVDRLDLRKPEGGEEAEGAKPTPIERERFLAELPEAVLIAAIQSGDGRGGKDSTGAPDNNR